MPGELFNIVRVFHRQVIGAFQRIDGRADDRMVDRFGYALSEQIDGHATIAQRLHIVFARGDWRKARPALCGALLAALHAGVDAVGNAVDGGGHDDVLVNAVVDEGDDTLEGGTGNDLFRLKGKSISELFEVQWVAADPDTAAHLLAIHKKADGTILESETVRDVEQVHIAGFGGNDVVDLSGLSASDIMSASTLILILRQTVPSALSARALPPLF